MVNQQLIWTALPNGLNLTGPVPKLRLSAFLSPRLSFDGDQTEGRLKAFEEFRDWPKSVRSADFSVAVVVDCDEAHPIPAEIASEVQPDSSVWKLLFNDMTLVKSRTTVSRAAPRAISSYPARELEASLRSGYVHLGQHSPYGAADRQKLSEAFPQIRSASKEERMSVRTRFVDRFRDLDSLPDAELADMHLSLGQVFLRYDPDMSLDEKLSAAKAIAARLVRSRRKKSGAVPLVPRGDDPVSPFSQLVAFHRRVPISTTGQAARRTGFDPLVEAPDFHQMLSSISEYRDLLRQLGLVVDLEIAATGFPTSTFGNVRRLQVVPNFASDPDPDRHRSPATRYLFNLEQDGGPLPFAKFCAAPRQADQLRNEVHAVDLETVGGLLNLNVPHPHDPQQLRHGLVQIDVDGAGLKIVNALHAIAQDAERPEQPVEGFSEPGAPTLRTSGIALVRAATDDAISDAIDQASDFEDAANNGPVDLFAEDLMRGYRADVRRWPADFPFMRDGSNRPSWRSLHARNGTIKIERSDESWHEVPVRDDEGFLQPALVQDAPADEEGQNESAIYIPESMLRWQGWTMSVPPPANPVDLGSTEMPGLSAPSLGLANVDVDFEAAHGTLPRLRFGDYYQFRLRTVDLAGNGLSVDEADRLIETLEAHHQVSPIHPIKANEFRYLRFDPILAPALVPREELTEGETADVMVIRSNAGSGVLAATYAAGLRDPKYRATNERHIVPPKASQAMVEAHGMLDGAFGAAGDPSKFYNICQREGGTLNDTSVVNITTGIAESLPDFERRDPVSGAVTSIPNGVLPRRAPGSAAHYAIHYEEQLRLPYLPDPLARGAALFGLPGTDSKFGETKPDTGALSYVGIEGNPLPLAVTGKDKLGFATKIDFSKRDAWPELLPFRLQLEECAGGGEEPNWDPRARVLRVFLSPGETKTVWLSCYPDEKDIPLFGLHYWWSDRVGSTAEGREFLNTAKHGALAMLTPAHRLTLVHAVEQPVRLSATSNADPLGIRRFRDDTFAYFSGRFVIHGPSTEKFDLLASWTEPAETDGGPRPNKMHVLEVPIVVERPAAASVPAPDPIATYDRDSLEFQAPPPTTANPAARQPFSAKHDFGDTKHRNVTYKLIATSRYREYFPTTISSDAMTRSIEMVAVIPSTAPPPAPEITSVVPVFGWDELVEMGDVTGRLRVGGGLRVYLGPTWFASGEGEQLAIVDTTSSDTWGLDPIQTLPSNVPQTIAPTNPWVSVPGHGTIYPHDVQYDKARKLWYCDIKFDVGKAYFPFRQLTLARYQKNALLPGLSLSPTVDAGLHQLAPNRSVALDYQELSGQRNVVIIVFGSGPPAPQGPQNPRGNVFEVSVEKLEPDRDERDEFAWTPDLAHRPVADNLTDPLSQLWAGQVLVPSPGQNGSPAIPRRLVIKEFEVFPAIASHPPGQGWIGEPEATTSLDHRLVYADTIRLR